MKPFHAVKAPEPRIHSTVSKSEKFEMVKPVKKIGKNSKGKKVASNFLLTTFKMIDVK